MFVFRNFWRPLFSCNTGFEIRLFALLPMNTKSTSFFRKSDIVSVLAFWKISVFEIFENNSKLLEME